MSTEEPDVGGTAAAAPARSGASHVGAGILLSRLAGLAREVITGSMLGIGVAADAFRAALRIPNLMQNLLGEGVLSASFIPVYSRLVDDEDEEKAGETAGAIAGLLAAATAVIVAGGVLAARPITVALTPGFVDNEAKLDLTVQLVKIMFPGVGMLVMSAWCLAILNSHRQFFLSYVAPVIWNVAQIIAVTAVAVGGSSQHTLAEGLAWGVVAGGIAQFLVQLPSVLRLIPRLRLSLNDRIPAVRDSLRRLGPVVFGRGVVQISGYVDLILASLLVTGALAADTAAQFFYLLPISLFGMSVAASELPELARLGQENAQEMRERVDRGLGRVAFFVVPTVAFYIAVGEPLIGALYERGKWDSGDTRLVWLALAVYSLGLVANTASRLLQNTLYALDDPRTPARIALVRVVAGSGIALALMFPLDTYVLDGTSIVSQSTLSGDGAGVLHLGVLGIAAGSAVAAWVEFALLHKALSWRIGSIALGGGRLPKLAAVAVVSALAGFVVSVVTSSLPIIATAVLSVGAAGFLYLTITLMLGFDIRRELSGVT